MLSTEDSKTGYFTDYFTDYHTKLYPEFSISRLYLKLFKFILNYIST